MFNKELKESLGKVLNPLVIFLWLPVVYAFSRFYKPLDMFFERIGYGLLFTLTFWFIIMVSSVVMGTSLFESERKNRAFEYLLTFPLSREKILIFKITPRFLVIASMVILYLPFYLSQREHLNYALFNPIYVIILNILLFFLSSSFSLFEIKNSMALFVLSIYGSLFIIYLKLLKVEFLKKLTLMHPMESAVILSLSVVVPFLFVSFYITFKNFDLSPLKVHFKKYILKTIWIVVFAFVLTNFF